MKTTVNSLTYQTGKQLRFAIALLVMITASHFANAASDLQPAKGTDTIMVQKQHTSRKHGVKLYPDANHQVLFFEVKGQYGKAYQLFIFDVEGKLVKQVSIKNKQSTVLENIDRGDYSFEVFSDDERIENGQVIVR